MKQPNFTNADTLLPAIIQDFHTQKVLMLGYMNQQAYQKTCQEGVVTFYSRSKQRLWTKGETSGNFLKVKEILTDCDQDTILVKAEPQGPTCHTGADTCFNESNQSNLYFLDYLAKIIRQKKNQNPENSYTAQLFTEGIKKIAQKVGEEAVELALEAQGSNTKLLLNEAADLVFHLLVLLEAKNLHLNQVVEVLQERHFKKK